MHLNSLLAAMPSQISGNVWKEWMETVEAQKISPEAEYSQIIVTTMDVVRYTYLLSTLVAAHQPALMVRSLGGAACQFRIAEVSCCRNFDVCRKSP
jgi:hypothetical protein